MAITATSLLPGRHGFLVNATSADLSGCEVLVAGVPGSSIFLDRILLNVSSDLVLTLGAGETDSGVTTPIVGPLSMAQNACLQMEFPPMGLKLADGVSLVIDASGAGSCCIFAQGRIL